jgi:hypothetical protein
MQIRSHPILAENLSKGSQCPADTSLMSHNEQNLLLCLTSTVVHVFGYLQSPNGASNSGMLDSPPSSLLKLQVSVQSLLGCSISPGRLP